MNGLKGDNFTKLYLELIRHVLLNGEKSAPRGMGIAECLGVQFELTNVDSPVPLQQSRKMNYRFGIMEGLMLILGEYPSDIVLKVNPKLAEFMNDNGREKNWDGAYPPRIKEWVPHIVKLLQADPDSRRAVIPIYGNSDRLMESKDIACTTTLQFLIRGGKLNMVASMRSNDLLWGTPNDIAQFTILQRGIASALDIPTGWYKHFAGSLHIYDNTSKQLEEMIRAENFEHEKYADFKHPSWNYMTLEYQREQITILFDGFREGVIFDTLMEPFRTYAEYMLKIKLIHFN